MRIKSLLTSEKNVLNTLNNSWYELLLLKMQLGQRVTPEWIKEMHNANAKIINS